MTKSALSIQFLSWEKGRNNEVMNFWFLSGLFFCNLGRSRVHLSPRIQLIVVQKSFISKIMVQNFERGDLRSNLSRFDVSDSFHGSSFSLHTKFERLLSKNFLGYATLSAPELELIWKLLHLGNIKQNYCCWFLKF